MKIAVGFFGLVLFAILNTHSAQAACGGGGYAPAPKSNSSNSTYTSSSVKQGPDQSAVLDTSTFNNVSGKLGLSYEQATAVIKAMNEVRASAKDTSEASKQAARKDFDKRLSEILKPQQYKDYQANANKNS